MPNLITDGLNRPLLPFCENGYDFLWEADGANSTLVMTQNAKFKFFLVLKQKGDKFLIKGEKNSRPPFALHLQQAIDIYAKKAGANVIFSNISPAHNRVERQNTAIKNIDFFTNHNFFQDKDIYLEIGFGSGRHILHQAKNNPEKFMIGVEIHKPSLEQTARQCEILGLSNVVLIDHDSRVLMEFLPSNSIEKIFVHFPVPWDKKPHRRVVCPHFVKQAARVLKKNGKVEVRTDSEIYFNYVVEVFAKQNKADIKILKNFDIEISSKYEDRWKRLEKNIYDIIIANHEESSAVLPLEMLKFDFFNNVDRIIDRFTPKLFRNEDFFVHFETLHSFGNERAVIKAAFGANDMAERAFVIVDKNGACYFPDKIYATRVNKMAHEIMTKWLNEQ